MIKIYWQESLGHVSPHLRCPTFILNINNIQNLLSSGAVTLNDKNPISLQDVTRASGRKPVPQCQGETWEN